MSEITRQQIDCAKSAIIGCIERYGHVYWGTIYDWASHSDSVPALQAALRELIACGEVRQREDEQEHDWEYSFI